ncbi:hypothetical protein TeGR_g12908, partial [Tetraparma gracilis]
MSASPPPSYLDAAKAAPAEAPEPPKPKKKATFAANVLPPSLCPPGGSSDSSASPVPPGKAAAARMQSTRYSRSLLRQTRRSTALGDVSVSTLDDVKPIDNTNIKPVRVLVTMYDIKPTFSNTVKNGLGFWVFYILREYFEKRNIPVQLFLKSITSTTTPAQVLAFIARNAIDVLVPSDVSDTQFVSKHMGEISPHVHVAISPNLETYVKLEDKWQTYEFCVNHDIPTPKTVKLDPASPPAFPFFLKVSSGTNGGRGVWLCRDQKALDSALAVKSNKEPGTLLLAQTPEFGKLVCAQVVYDHGTVLGFFFAQTTNPTDLAGVGNKYMFSFLQSSALVSHVKVELTDAQWDAVTSIFKNIGAATDYHGMIDIEFIIAGADASVPGAVYLLEMNPRFSGDIHTALSNPGFLDLYFDVIFDRGDHKVQVVNFAKGVEMNAKIRDFNPTRFYVVHPRMFLNLRNWNKDIMIKGRTTPTAPLPDAGADADTGADTGADAGADQPSTMSRMSRMFSAKNLTGKGEDNLRPSVLVTGSLPRRTEEEMEMEAEAEEMVEGVGLGGVEGGASQE